MTSMVKDTKIHRSLKFYRSVFTLFLLRLLTFSKKQDKVKKKDIAALGRGGEGLTVNYIYNYCRSRGEYYGQLLNAIDCCKDYG